MKSHSEKFPGVNRIGTRLRGIARDFVAVRNPAYSFPAEEFLPMAPIPDGAARRLVAVVQDMDGTTTTTETLCIHSLETMIRRITAQPSVSEWRGLDRDRDYPRIIGNSTTRHVEYLIETYRPRIRPRALVRAMLEAAAWTLTEGEDPGRQREVRNTLDVLGWSRALDPVREWRTILRANGFDCASTAARLDRLADRLTRRLQVRDFDRQVRVATDIYYARYHEILKQLGQGQGRRLARDLVGGRSLVEPMPGVAVFQTLIRGWLGDRAGALYDTLRDSARADLTLPPASVGRRRLAALGRRLRRAPLKTAVVTSSIAYEAGIVLGEVVRSMRRQIRQWPVCSDLADRIRKPEDLFDVVVTANDSSEIRLKPHRDLYSIALHALGLMPSNFPDILGLEDSESGIIALRTAGIGRAVALPFADTAGHDFSAAAHSLPGGLPQAILEHQLFMKGPST